MIALLLAIQIFSIMQVDGGIWAHLISFFYFYSIKYLLIGVGRKKKEASIHDILKNLRVLRRNTDEGQHQDLDAGVVNSNHYWLAILNNLNLRIKSSFEDFDSFWNLGYPDEESHEDQDYMTDEEDEYKDTRYYQL